MQQGKVIDVDVKLLDHSKSILSVSGFNQDLWYEFNGIESNKNIKNTNNLDFVAIALLPAAMVLKKTLRIHGSIDEKLLDNLFLYQKIWHSWLPNKYQIIDIVPDKEIYSNKNNQKNAIALASGGVDSTFMLTQHVFNRESRLNRKIVHALLLHGFDMPLNEQNGFKNLYGAVKNITDQLELSLVTCRTNWRYFSPDYEMSFMAGMFSVMHQLSGVASYGLAASDEPYTSYVNSPWGSNYITNHLLSSSNFSFQECGGEVDRLNKVANLMLHKKILDNLRVCWEGARTGLNCGVCEKCLRTQLELYVNNAPHSMAFVEKLSIRNLEKIQLRNSRQVDFYSKLINKLLVKNTPESYRLILAIRNIISCYEKNNLKDFNIERN